MGNFDSGTGLIEKYIGFLTQASDANAKNQMAAKQQDYEKFNTERSAYLKNISDQIDNKEQLIKSLQESWHKAPDDDTRDTIQLDIDNNKGLYEGLVDQFGKLYSTPDQIADLEKGGNNVSEYRGLDSKGSQGQQGANGGQGNLKRHTTPNMDNSNTSSRPSAIPSGMNRMLSNDGKYRNAETITVSQEMPPEGRTREDIDREGQPRINMVSTANRQPLNIPGTKQPREIPTRGIIQPAKTQIKQVQSQSIQPTNKYAGKTTAQIKNMQYEETRQDKLNKSKQGSKQGDSSLAARREKAYIPNPDGTFTMGYTDEKSGDFTPFLRNNKPIILTGKQVLLSSGKRAESLINPYQVALGKSAGREAGKLKIELEGQIVTATRSNRTIKRGLGLVDKGIISGSFANVRLGFNKFLVQSGAELTGERVQSTEAFAAVMARDVINILGSGDLGAGTGISDNDRLFAAKIVGGDITLNEKSIRMLLDINKRVNDAKITIANRRIDLLKTRYKADDPFAGNLKDSFKNTQKQTISKKEMQDVQNWLNNPQ